MDVLVEEPEAEMGLTEGEGWNDEGAGVVGTAVATPVEVIPTAGGTIVVPSGETEEGVATGTTVVDSPAGTDTAVVVSPTGTTVEVSPPGTMDTVVVPGTTTAGVEVVTAVTTIVLVPVTGTLKVEVPLVVGT